MTDSTACQRRLSALGRAYPRTCRWCQLGPCTDPQFSDEAMRRLAEQAESVAVPPATPTSIRVSHADIVNAVRDAVSAELRQHDPEGLVRSAVQDALQRIEQAAARHVATITDVTWDRLLGNAFETVVTCGTAKADLARRIRQFVATRIREYVEQVTVGVRIVPDEEAPVAGTSETSTSRPDER